MAQNYPSIEDRLFPNLNIHMQTSMRPHEMPPSIINPQDIDAINSNYEYEELSDLAKISLYTSPLSSEAPIRQHSLTLSIYSDGDISSLSSSSTDDKDINSTQTRKENSRDQTFFLCCDCFNLSTFLFNEN